MHSALRDSWRALWTSRLLVWGAGVGAMAIWGRAGKTEKFDTAHLTQGLGRVGDLLVAPAARWDSAWYLAIVHDGYAGHALGGASSRPAFFPLYPLLIWVLHTTGAPALLAGIGVSLAALFVALVLIHRLATLELGPGRPFGHAQAPRLAVLATALFPMAFFLSAVYSEALYLALSVGVFLAARHGRWAWAGALGAGAAATRSIGVLLIVPLLVLYLYGPREDRPPDTPSDTSPASPSDASSASGHARSLRRLVLPCYRVRPDVVWLGLVPVGLLAYLAYLALAGVDARAPFHAQEVWFRHFAGPFGGVWDGLRAGADGVRQLLSGARHPVYFTQATGDPFVVAGHNLVALGFLLLALTMLVGVSRRLPLAYGVYVITALSLPLSYPVTPQPLMSMSRFVVVLFPLALWLGAWLARRPRARAPVLAAYAVGLALFGAQFATWHWVA